MYVLYYILFYITHIFIIVDCNIFKYYTLYIYMYTNVYSIIKVSLTYTNNILTIRIAHLVIHINI